MEEVLEQEYSAPVRWVESKAQNTHENALLSAKLLHHEGISRVLVVSHGVDTRRTRREFRAVGLEVISAATDIPSLTIASPIQLLPSMSALHQSYLALYELFGNELDASQQEGQGRVLTVPVATPTLPNGSRALMRR